MLTVIVFGVNVLLVWYSYSKDALTKDDWCMLRG